MKFYLQIYLRLRIQITSIMDVMVTDAKKLS